MSELDLFRDFRRGVAAPSEDARRRASTQLTSAIEGEPQRRTRILRLIRRRPGRTALVFATVVAVTAATLFVSSPWKTAPGFLERVQAAVTPPPGSILHMKWELTSTSTDPPCTVTHGPNEIWIDQTAPHMYRALLDGPPLDLDITDPRELACSTGTPSELGASFDMEVTLRFVPPNMLSANTPRFVFPVDPVKDLRIAISAGRAHDEGTMQLAGRPVERIRIDPPNGCPVQGCARKPQYAYVDPETFHPVQIECEDCGVIALPGRPVLRLRMVTRYSTFEYLPRTDENLLLTDIRAQHPGATVDSWGGTPGGGTPGPLLTPGLVLHVPAAKTVRGAEGAQSARVTFEVTATEDDGSGDFPVSCWPRSGSRFPLGETLVQCAAAGPNGSAATAAFPVTVTGRR